MSRILVTGGSGFLGSHIADTLTARGHEVVILDRRPSPYLQPGQDMRLGDICDYDTVVAATRGCDFVYHLAAQADMSVASRRPVDTAIHNVLGTVNVLEAARLASIKRLLFASTVYVYSREGGFYRCSKQACEAYVEEYRRQFGLEYTILRYGSLYGPRADESNGVYRLLLQAVTEGRIRHTGAPDDTREYVHVEDAARLSADALGDEYANQHLIITGHQATRLRDLFVMFSEILGRDLDVDYVAPEGDQRYAHYRLTPYSFNPRLGHKLTSNYFVDMGQGILQMLEQLHAEGRISSAHHG